MNADVIRDMRQQRRSLRRRKRVRSALLVAGTALLVIGVALTAARMVSGRTALDLPADPLDVPGR